MTINNAIELLKQKKFKITPPRLKVLEILQSAIAPLSAEDIIIKLKGKGVNNVTVYRTLSSFAEKGILRQVDLRRDSVCYELKDNHHHHLVCESCGDLEDFEMCIEEVMVNKVLQNSKKFKKINDHALEFFGQCNKCLKYV